MSDVENTSDPQSEPFKAKDYMFPIPKHTTFGKMPGAEITNEFQAKAYTRWLFARVVYELGRWAAWVIITSGLTTGIISTIRQAIGL